MNNKNFRNIILIIISLTLNSCNGKNEKAVSFKKIDGNRILMCDIDKITETREIKLSQFVESSEFIALSNDEHALLGNTWLEEFSSGYFVLADFTNKLFLFNERGNHLKTWEPGKGPNEFIIPGHPQIVGNNLYINDNTQDKLLKYSVNGKSMSSVNLSKSTGVSIVLNDSTILTAGNSESNQDPFLICVQDFNGKILQSIDASYQTTLVPQLSIEKVIHYPVENGLNIHFPGNDTLMNYNIEENTLTPVAVFNSKKHIQINKELYLARKKSGLEITDKSLTHSVTVVPVFESEKYFFVSVYSYGELDRLPWYCAKQRDCLIDKETQEAFYVHLIDDFWGGSRFKINGSSKVWSKVFIENTPIISVKRRFEKALEQNHEIEPEMLEKLKNIISTSDENDNNAIFKYTLK